MKIEMYKNDKGIDGYRLIAETRDEKLILGSFRNGAFFTDGTFMYEGYNCEGIDRMNGLVSQVMIAHNKSFEKRAKEEPARTD